MSDHSAYALRNTDNNIADESDISVEVHSLTESTIEFDIKGIDASFANAFRRILLAEVPSIAIEKVLIADNTSIIADEVLSHRLGLIPINADPRLLQDGFHAKRRSDEMNTIVFKLSIICRKNEDGTIVNTDVYSSHLEWLPEGSKLINTSSPPQSTRHQHASGTQTPKTYTNFSKSQKDNVPERRQRIELEAHAGKGIGKEHAKWSPVATAFYRMCPEIVLKKEIADKAAEALMAKCGGDVFKIENVEDKKIIVVSNPRNYHLCQHCLHDPEWAEFIQVNRIINHFIFTIESTGAMRPDVLFEEAIHVLKKKCELTIEGLDLIE